MAIGKVALVPNGSSGGDEYGDLIGGKYDLREPVLLPIDHVAAFAGCVLDVFECDVANRYAHLQ